MNSISWESVGYNGKTCMNLVKGEVDFSKKGYLYKIDVKNFERLDEIQWFCKTAVEPFDFEETDANTPKDRILRKM